ncbi:hypothetical protein [Blastococcus sp. TF02A-26]|uniref:hypothetical protein n=1 Tax=Blastococcus sp. TF02A-26 TaxID=2250577 RepID=UPI000DE9E813|nr:hypothetical protein [Blastococcus sp. TF02A-26]RBY86118.1 hypothetical protein DQ240_09910 [Blastococcus sp. TF02A-26]
MTPAGYRARWRGLDHRAAPELREDGWWVVLVDENPAEDFEPLGPDGPWVRAVPVRDCDAVVHVRRVGTWRGVPCSVHDERSGELLVHYAGGSVPEAQALGFTRLARGVHARWVSRDEVRGQREESVPLSC